MASLKVLNNYASTGGLSPAERGRPTTTAPKTEGGLLPSATKSGEAPAEKSSESEAAATKSTSDAEAPASAPAATPPAATEPDAKP